MSTDTNLPDKIGKLLTRISDNSYRQSDQALQEQLGIGMSQLRITTILQEIPNVSQREVADRLGQSEASISRQVKLLADKGLVTIAVDASEKRKRNLSLTPKGARLSLAASELLSKQWQDYCSALNSKQQTALIEILRLMDSKDGVE